MAAIFILKQIFNRIYNMLKSEFDLLSNKYANGEMSIDDIPEGIRDVVLSYSKNTSQEE